MRRFTMGGSSSSGIFACVSPRIATLAIAILGIVIHLNTYSWLGSLNSILPDVPERVVASVPTASLPFIPFADRFAPSAAKADQSYDLAAAATVAAAATATTTSDVQGSANKHVYLPEWIAEAKAYLKAQGLSYVPTQASTKAESSSNNNAAAESAKANDAITYGRYSDVSDALPAGFPIVDDGAEDLERMQWDALRLVIGALRWYILLSVVCCCAGVVGVLRSQLLLSRLFVLHSFLDFLLSTLSLFALALVCTYPSVRAHLCDEFGSGELRGWFSSSKSTRGSNLAVSDRAHLSANLAQTGGSALSGGSPDVNVAASGWDTLLDGVFASENCEESFRTTLVPLLMVFGLCFTAVRLQCFFLVQRFYASLLRTKLYHYGYAIMSASEESGVYDSTSQLHGDSTREWRRKNTKLVD